MPTNLTDVATFTDPIVAPADSDAQAAAAYVPGYQGLANRTRLHKQILDGTASIDAVTRTVCFDAAEGHAPNFSGTPPDWAPNINGGLLSLALSGIDYLPIRLRHGSTLTRVRMLVKPGTARVGGARVNFQLDTFTQDFATPAAPSNSASGPYFDDGTTNLQLISSGTISVAVTSSKTLRLKLTSGASGASDLCYSFELQFTDPGPRNF